MLQQNVMGLKSLMVLIPIFMTHFLQARFN